MEVVKKRPVTWNGSRNPADLNKEKTKLKILSSNFWERKENDEEPNLKVKRIL